MKRTTVNIIGFSDLYHVSQIHDTDPVADMLYHAKIVCDKEIADALFFLNILQKVDDLCLDGNVERRNRFVADDKVWFKCQRSRNSDSLSLAAGKFMRISPDVVRFQSNRFQQLLHAFFSLFFIVHVMNHHRLLNNLTDGKTGI